MLASARSALSEKLASIHPRFIENSSPSALVVGKVVQNGVERSDRLRRIIVEEPLELKVARRKETLIITYAVRTGDTLISIAERYGITVQDLVRERKFSRG